MPEDIILEMKDITKRFPGVTALKDVSLKLKKGHVHTILGENGAGKSTLMKVLAGVHTDYEGDIFIKGQKVYFENPKDAQEKGIAIIYQELSLCPNLSVGANIFANREMVKSNFLLDEKKINEEARKILDQLDARIDPRTMVKDLSVSQQQLVEIAKALSLKAEIIIMDEPTSALSERETEKLFGVIERLKKQGVSMLYISHRMDEIFKVSDEITVLRDGQYIGTVPVEEAEINELIKMMAGRELKDIYPDKDYDVSDETIFKVNKLSKEGLFNDINLDLKKGEIVGIFGLVGSGRTEVAKTIFGIIPKDSGHIEVRGKKVDINNPTDAIDNGLAFITENRKEEGLVLFNSVSKNVTMVTLDKILNKFKFLDKKREDSVARKAVDSLRIKTPGVSQKVNNLSGGNQQKVVLAKWLEVDPEILILDEPTRGIDVGAKHEIYQIMRKLASKGTGIIMISSELPEIMGMSDRIVVMRDGQFVKEFVTSRTTQEEIMLYATGGNRR
ncbi:sugar ABC transporter ATP-binding protein [Halothermothrix orenii]|uniref:Ribose/galactose/methyl galactoside import ATP-binding protein n=1 Tax=Halothermothrix orenii (strain H 168 / OCM 544 / DSM 9562) TaxID=373903 RepID=B8D163_HALOH|nr:sugar ABC transporter ATP-binding protein [Halothermothrix orenii]ACL71015.1 ABC transporter related [Halothermothrix orenii H 168]